MVVCAVATCRSKLKCGISFHCFPQESGRQNKWKTFCKRKDKFNVKTARICELHFEKDCFERDLRNELLGLSQRKILKPTACPTLFDATYPIQISAREERQLKKQQNECISELLKGTTCFIK